MKWNWTSFSGSSASKQQQEDDDDDVEEEAELVTRQHMELELEPRCCLQARKKFHTNWHKYQVSQRGERE